ncbi:MAG: methionine biosynthesis protein MetW [Victivallaceae bacterium]|nr:methionine biosynthesis protein MetW [Victivallaceae bacterium]
MMRHLDLDVNRRRDLEVISALVSPGDRVLDLGCGDGSFLAHLKEARSAEVLGLEIDPELVGRCISNGVPVIQSDLDNALDFAENDAFDLVVVSHTLQEIRRPDLLLRHIVRVGRRAAVSFINFAHWRCRLQLLAGKMPRNAQLPYQWYNTPNIHLGTIADFRETCRNFDICIVQETPIAARFPFLSRFFPNLFAVGAVFVLEKASR